MGMYDYDGDLSLIDNGNLLVNPDFRINQRHITEISTETYPLKDFADMWKLDNAPMGKCKAGYSGDGVYFINYGDENACALTQLVQQGVIDENETYTIQVNISGYSGNVYVCLYELSYPYTVIIKEQIQSTGITKVTGKIPVTGYTGRYSFSIKADVSSSFTVDWCKLELGSGSSFEHPDYDTEILKIEEIGMSYSNPNILCNSNFKINQRGESEYTEGYTVDRWAIHGEMTVKPVSTGLELTSSTRKSFLCQPIDPGELLGKKITFSCSVKVTEGYWYVQLRTTKKRYNIAIIGNKSGTYKVSAEVPTDTTQIQVRFVNAQDKLSQITVRWAKLEIGGIRSLYTPPDKSVEYLRCSRYYIRYAPVGKHIDLSAILNYYKGKAIVPVSLPVEMYKPPKFKISDNGIKIVDILNDTDDESPSEPDELITESGISEVHEIKSNGDNHYITLSAIIDNRKMQGGSGYDYNMVSRSALFRIDSGSYMDFDSEMEIELDDTDI